MSRRKAKKFIEAAGAGAPASQATAEMAGLLGAVELLKESAPVAQAPDRGFQADLRTNLMARYDELVAGESAPAPVERARSWKSWTLWTIPAVAAVAAIIISLVLVVTRTVGTPTVASLKVYEGKAVVIESSGQSHTVAGSRDVRVQDTVKVDGGSRAEIAFKNKNIARLEAGTEVKVTGYADKIVALAEKTGKVYNRVMKGMNYSVTHGVVKVKAVGTAFDVEAVGKGLNNPVFEGTDEVSWPSSGDPFKVEQGNQAVVTFTNGGYDIKVEAYDISKLDFSWLAFNRDLDRKAGFPLGTLENLEPTPPQGTQPPGTVPGVPGTTTTPGGPPPVVPPGSTPTPTTPTTPQGTPSASMSIGSAGPPVSLQWSGTNTSAADNVFVLRVTGQGVPSYPGNAMASFPPSQTSYSDPNVQPGLTYTYAVAYVSGGSVLATSNGATVTVPKPPEPPPSLNINLGGYPVTGGFQLKWSSDGAADVWVVQRSQNGSGFSEYARVTGGGNGGSFTDQKVDAASSYSWRVTGIVGGKVAGTSNAISN